MESFPRRTTCKGNATSLKGKCKGVTRQVPDDLCESLNLALFVFSYPESKDVDGTLHCDILDAESLRE